MFLSYLAKLNGQRLRSSLISANSFACGRAGNRKLVLLLTHIFRHWLGGNGSELFLKQPKPFYRDESIPLKLST